jgi:site-specific DNA recombinase
MSLGEEVVVSIAGAVAVSSKPFAGCIRVSDTRGRRDKANFSSPEEQKAGILEAAGRESVEVVFMTADFDYSGGTFARPGFQQALAGIRAGELAGIIVYRWDRFGRNLKESLTMIEEIEAAGGKVISATEPVVDGSGGILTRDMMLGVANFYRLRIQEGWIATHDRLHERGCPNGRLPTGYRKGSDGRLEPNEHAEDVAWAFEARAGGASLTAIAGEFERREVENGAGSRRWYPHAVARVLGNRAYLGEVRRGDRPVVTGAHPAVVDRATFEAAQRPRLKARPNARGTHLLTGLVRCAGCLHPMSITGARTGARSASYRCRDLGYSLPEPELDHRAPSRGLRQRAVLAPPCPGGAARDRGDA